MTKNNARLTTGVVALCLTIAWFAQVWYLLLNNTAYTDAQEFGMFFTVLAEGVVGRFAASLALRTIGLMKD